MKKTILLVEDEAVLRDLYEEELAEEGYEVHTASSGKEALQKFEKLKPDMVILDIVMPGMNGIDALRRLKEMEEKVPVILHTSYSDYRRDPRSDVADAFVIKSSDFRELKEKVRELLEE